MIHLQRKEPRMLTKLTRTIALAVFLLGSIGTLHASSKEIAKLKPVHPRKDLALKGMLDDFLRAHPSTKEFAGLIDDGSRNYRGKWMKVRVHWVEDARNVYMRGSVRGLAWKNNIYIRFDPSKAGNSGWSKTVKGWKYKGSKSTKFIIYNPAYRKQVASTLIHEAAHAQGFILRGKAYGELVAFRAQGAFCERIGIRAPYATKELAKFANESKFRGWLKQNHGGYKFHFAQQEAMKAARGKWFGRTGKLARGTGRVARGTLRWAGPAYVAYGVVEYSRGNVDKGMDVFSFVLSYGVVSVLFAIPEALLLPAGPPGWTAIAAIEGTKIALSILIQDKVKAYMTDPMGEWKFDSRRAKAGWGKAKASVKKGAAKGKKTASKAWKKAGKKAKSIGKSIKSWF